MAQDGAGEFGEEALDEVEPGAVLGREGELEAAGRSRGVARSVREREMSVDRPISSPLIANSTACRHCAITPIFVQPIANEEFDQQTASSTQVGFMELVV